MKRSKRLFLLMLPLLLLAGCQVKDNQQVTTSSARSSKQVTTSQKKAAAKSSAAAKEKAATTLAEIPLAGTWTNSDGVIFTFGNDRQWTYQTGTDSGTAAKITGTYQLAGVVGADVLLKLHGLDQDIGNIGNYLWLTFTKDQKTIDLAGFGKFQLDGNATDLAMTVQIPHAFTTKPKTLAQLLVGTWMDTDENATDAITMNFDPNGSYQRYLSGTKQVEQGTYQVTLSHDSTDQIQIKLLTTSGQEQRLKFGKNGDFSQLTTTEGASTTYVKNLIPATVN
ncbi:hypothetical protein [Lapidilactobacillus luobeiensis]|uniref:hypothetical protein n=1 Tax=Lapidilactobacillus luobeiensis TaxID=2950371 RepID=UPI0021C3DA7A|nr:hypothetical protein [Lapidilactobacillus luobeiensis]